MTAIASSVQSIVDEIDAKLAELRPVVEEYNTLEAARAVLTERGAISAPARLASPRAARPVRPARAVARRAPRGANRAAILSFVASNPGATVAQIADATGIARPTTHSTVYTLRRKGELAADGNGVRVPSRATPTARAARRVAARRAAATSTRGTGKRGSRRASVARRTTPARASLAVERSVASSTAESPAIDAG